MLAEQGNRAHNRREFEVAAKLGPSIATIYEALSYPLMLTGDYGNAVTKLTPAIALDPASPTAYLNLGDACLTLGDTAAAIDALGTGVFRHLDAAPLI